MDKIRGEEGWAIKPPSYGKRKGLTEAYYGGFPRGYIHYRFTTGRVFKGLPYLDTVTTFCVGHRGIYSEFYPRGYPHFWIMDTRKGKITGTSQRGVGPPQPRDIRVTNRCRTPKNSGGLKTSPTLGGKTHPPEGASTEAPTEHSP